MASTFDNDLRLEEMATGENAGSWGTKTNTNLELIADAFGYGTFTIADADTTLTMPDGSDTDNALRSLYLKISSSADLTTTRTLTLAPNSVSKLWYIENNTSGGQTITISQGSGANVSILNGQAKLIATDGAGAGAAVIDATQDLAIPDLFIDDDLSLQSDGAIINFGENADITLTHAADTSLTLGGAGTTTGLVVNNTAADGDPFLSFALSGTQTFTMGIDDGDSDKFKIGTSAIGTNTRLSIDSSGNIEIPDGSLTIINDDNSTLLTLISTDADANVGPRLDLYRNSASPDVNDLIGDFRYLGENDAGQTTEYAAIEAKILDMADGTEDGFLDLRTIVSGTSRSRITMLSDETVVNDGSRDLDFRVESDGNTHMLFVDAENNRVGIGTSDTADNFRLNIDSSGTLGARIYSGTASSAAYLYLENNNNHQYSMFVSGSSTAAADDFELLDATNDNSILFHEAGAETVFNQDSRDIDFRVESDSDANMLWVDAEQNRVKIATSSDYGAGVLNIDGAVYFANSSNKVIQGLTPTGWGYSPGAYGVIQLGGPNTGGTVSIGYDPSSNLSGSFTGNGEEMLFAGDIEFYQPNSADDDYVRQIRMENGTGVIINEGGADLDFRVESDSNTHMLFVDAGNNSVSIGESTNAPNATLEVQGGVTMTAGWDRTLQVAGDSSSGFPVIVWNSQDAGYAGIGYDRTNTTGPMKFWTGATTSDVPADGQRALELGISGGESVFNQDSNDIDFRIESDANDSALFINAGESTIGINSGGSTAATVYINQSQGSRDSGLYITDGGYGVVGTAQIFLSGGIGDNNKYHAHSIASRRTSTYNDGAIFEISGEARLGNSFSQQKLDTNSGAIFNEDGASSQDFRVESDTSTHAIFVDASENAIGLRRSDPAAGVSADDAIIGWGGGGQILQTSETVANNAYVDIVINSGGGGFTGQLFVTNTVSANAAVRTHSMYFVAGRGTDTVATQLGTDNGGSGGASFSITFPSNGKIRVTNDNANSCQLVVLFIGSKAL